MFFILGGRKKESPSIHILNAGQETTIATREIDKVISLYNEEELSTAYLESRVVDRDKFLIVHLPNHTLLYNHTIASKFGIDAAWSYVKTGVEEDHPWRARYGVFDPNAAKWIYGDLLENKLGYLDQQSAKQYDDQVENICYTPIVPIDSASINAFEIDTITGYATQDFTSAFSMSFDGVTYGQEYFNKISEPSNYNTRYISRRLGYIREQFNFKFRFVSPDKMAFSGLRIDYS
jgi:3-polyprenyl-4-hydroxybenzoate decarboxylase